MFVVDDVDLAAAVVVVVVVVIDADDADDDDDDAVEKLPKLPKLLINGRYCSAERSKLIERRFTNGALSINLRQLFICVGELSSSELVADGECQFTALSQLLFSRLLVHHTAPGSSREKKGEKYGRREQNNPNKNQIIRSFYCYDIIALRSVMDLLEMIGR